MVILKRGRPPQGHVTFFDSHGIGADKGSVLCFGGNQSDMVKYNFYEESDVLGYRWPE